MGGKYSVMLNYFTKVQMHVFKINGAMDESFKIYGRSEIWILYEGEISVIQAVEINYLRGGCG